jgi:hypothetical protein
MGDLKHKNEDGNRRRLEDSNYNYGKNNLLISLYSCYFYNYFPCLWEIYNINNRD